MKKGIVEAGASPLVKGGQLLARSLSQISERLPSPPGIVSDAQVAHGGLERRFGMIAASLNGSSNETAEDQVAPATDLMARSGVMRRRTVLEMRPLIPEEDLCTRVIERYLGAMNVARGVMRARRRDICVVPNTHPIMPTERMDSPVEPDKVWLGIEHEYDDLRKQVNMGHGESRDTALVVMGEPEYAGRVFGSDLLLGSKPLEEHQPVMLTPVGEEARELVLAPPLIR